MGGKKKGAGPGGGGGGGKGGKDKGGKGKTDEGGKGGKGDGGKERKDKGGKGKGKNKKKWEAPSQNYRNQLAALGLRIVEVEGDGNCFFRSVTDQVEGPGGDHAMLRKRCVAFMELNSGDFEPFVEDDEGWGTYIARMAKDGEWAGNMEVQAASKVLGMNICIHQADKPRWEVHNFEGRRCIHLSYEGEEHYNSIRLEGDRGEGPAEEIVITEVEGRGPRATDRASMPLDDKDVAAVARSTGGTAAEAEAALRKCGSVDLAVEAVIAGRAAGGEEAAGGAGGGEGEGEGGGGEGAEGAEEGAAKEEEGPWLEVPSRHQPKVPGRNKDCPCGSKIKYKNCCGNKAAKKRKEKAEREGGVDAADAGGGGAAAVHLLGALKI